MLESYGMVEVRNISANLWEIGNPNLGEEWLWALQQLLHDQEEVTPH